MQQDLQNALRRVIDAAGSTPECIPIEGLFVFSPMKGILWNKDVLFVGRALNGWDIKTLIKFEDFKDPAKISYRLAESMKLSGWGQEQCPIAAIYREWIEQWQMAKLEKKPGYNINRSQFWSVIRDVVKKPETETDNDWPSRVAWTNLYKLNPKNCGNPDGKLRQCILEASIQLLAVEVHLLQPRLIVFLTGTGWAISFLKKFETSGANQEGLKEWAIGIFEDVPVLVLPHPERKKRKPFVDKISQFAHSIQVPV